jgi:hypothetical protein
MFQGFDDGTGFYVGFDVLYQIYIKYLLAYLPTKDKTKFLHTDIPVLCEWFFQIWEQFHGTVADIDKVDQHFDPFTAAHHITAQ